MTKEDKIIEEVLNGFSWDEGEFIFKDKVVVVLKEALQKQKQQLDKEKDRWTQTIMDISKVKDKLHYQLSQKDKEIKELKEKYNLLNVSNKQLITETETDIGNELLKAFDIESIPSTCEDVNDIIMEIKQSHQNKIKEIFDGILKLSICPNCKAQNKPKCIQVYGIEQFKQKHQSKENETHSNKQTK